MPRMMRMTLPFRLLVEGVEGNWKLEVCTNGSPCRSAMRHPHSRIKPRLGAHQFLHDQTGGSLRVARFAGLFGMPAGVLGEESPRCGTLLREIKAVIDGGGRSFASRSPPTGCRNVLIGGIPINNCALHTSLDLVRHGYGVFVVVGTSGTNSKLAKITATTRLVQAGAVPVGLLNALTEPGRDFAGPHGRGMMEIIQKQWPASTVGQADDTTPDGHGMPLPG